MKKLDVSSTAVLAAPIVRSSVRRRCDGDRLWVQVAEKAVRGEEPTEKEYLGRDKPPDAEFGRFALMHEINELLF